MKRFFAVLLCLLMCLSMLPITAFAGGADIVNEDDEGDVVKQEHSHDPVYVDGKDPDCDGGHIAYYKCPCGKLFSDADGEEEISSDSVQLPPKHTKPADEEQIKKIPATCTEKGQVKYKCAKCGDDVTEYQKKLGHQLTAHSYVAQTCTTDGNYTYYSCDRCGKLYWNEQAEYAIALSDTVIPKGHSLTHVEAVAPTCTQDGNIEYYVCGACGKLFSDAGGTEEITGSVVRSALGHNILKVEAEASTCAAAGNTEHWKCEYCGTLFADADGTETTTAEAVTIARLQHTLTKTEATAATCDTDGNIEYWKCSGCEALFRDEAGENAVEAEDVVIGKLGHDLEEVPANPACLEDGNIQYWICKRDGCGKLFSDEEGTTEIQQENTLVPEIGHHDFDGGVCRVCRAEDPDYEGPTFKDADLSIVAGEGLVIRIDADFDATMAKEWSIAINGETISKEFIDVTRGSTVFHIDGIALETLEPGTYSITVTIDGNPVTGHLVVEAPPATYDVIIPTMENGEVTVDKASAAEGETVTLTISPARGYVLKKNSLSVKNKSTGTGITVTSNQFTMPAAAVEVAAKFVKEFTVNFDTVLPISTVTKPANKKVQDGDTIAASDMPEPEDSAKHHDFKGWYKDSDYKTPFKAGTDTITADITLYAKWTHDYPDSKDVQEGKGICPYCWEADHSFKTGVKDPDFTAEIVRSNGKTAHYGSYFPMTVNTYYRYVKGSVEVKVDGKTLSEDKYTVFSPKHGTSTIVELDRAYIRKLPVGKYAISIKTNLGTAKGFFWVSSSPKTADDSNVALYVTVGVISAAAVAGIAYYLIKKRKK